MRKLVRRLRYLWHRDEIDRDLQDEMRAHREMMSDDRQASFGNSLRFQEDAREVWGWGWLDELQQDLVFGARQLRRAPGFTLTAIAVLAVGIGLNLAFLQVGRAISDSRIPVADADSLLRVVRQSPERERWAFPPEATAFFRQHADLFAYVVGERLGAVPVQVAADDEDSRARFVSGSYFDDLGLTAARGRLLDARDGLPGAPLVAVLSEGYWQRRFGGDPAVVETVLAVNDLPVRVVGVAPAGFAGLQMSQGDLWLPIAARAPLVGEPQAVAEFGRPDTGIAGKLRPGVSLEAARTQLAALAVELRGRQPDVLEDGETVHARPLADDETDRRPIVVMEFLFGLVLLASCANLGNMLLARGLAREREIETRIAVGAGRRRLVRQLMTESLLLAVLGSLGGLVVGRIAARLLAAQFGRFTLVQQITTDLPVVIAAGALGVISALVFGLAPALQLTSGRRRATRSRQTLVAVQVAISCGLLIMSGLMTRGAERQTTLAGTEDYTSLVVVQPNLRDANLSGPAARQALDAIAENLSRLPEVADLVIAANPIYGASVDAAPGMPMILELGIDPGYFRVMGLAPIQGRVFQPGDRDVVVVSARAALAAFDGESPLGRAWDPGRGTSGPTVIGVVENGPLATLRDPGAVESYLPLTDETLVDADVILRTTGDGRRVLRRARDAASLPGLTPSVWVLQTPVDQLLEHAVSATQIISGLGVTASALAAFGIFGLMAFSVRERAREIAIHLTLGARARTIAGVLLAQYARPFGLGMLAGMAMAVAGERALIGIRLGLGVTAFDVGGYLLGLVAFALTAVLAVLVPLRRALRIDPASVLRSE